MIYLKLINLQYIVKHERIQVAKHKPLHKYSYCQIRARECPDDNEKRIFTTGAYEVWEQSDERIYIIYIKHNIFFKNI